MFSRYRKTPPSSANSPNRRRSAKSNNSNNDPAAALSELRNALNRLEELTSSFQSAATGLLADLQAVETKDKAAAAAASKPEGNKPVDAEAAENDIADGENNEEEKKESATTKTKPTIFRRSPSATASDLLLASNAHFLSIPKKEEEEMVELIRRVAELVVLSERMAGQILEGERSFSNSKRGDDNDEEEQQDETTNSSEDAMPYLALFDLFCERNALANIVNVVTCVAFAPVEDRPSRTNSSNSPDKAVKQPKETGRGAVATTQIPYILPPLTIATQAIQSISILIQNVSRATSLSSYSATIASTIYSDCDK